LKPSRVDDVVWTAARLFAGDAGAFEKLDVTEILRESFENRRVVISRENE